jgi:phosphoribosyl 1,2-cyclic phosphodiesterase
VGYAADLGTWGSEHVELLSNVDLLALEFNHDVGLEKGSGRSPHLIARVLGDDGHLSNAQAAGLLRRVIERSDAGRPRQLVQLHLSRDCNHPDLAAEEARLVLRELMATVEVHTASQHAPTPTFHLRSHAPTGFTPGRVKRPRKPTRPRDHGPMLPGMEQVASLLHDEA